MARPMVFQTNFTRVIAQHLLRNTCAGAQPPGRPRGSGGRSRAPRWWDHEHRDLARHPWRSRGPRASARRCAPGRPRCRAARARRARAARTIGAFSPTPAVNDDRVDAAELRRVRADVLAEAVHVHVEGEGRRGVARRAPLEHVAHVVGAGEPEQAAALVEQRRRSRRVDSPARGAGGTSTAGSMSPERVPMTSPSSGVRPIEVSTERPPRSAQTDAPLPRCSTIWWSSASGRPSSTRRLLATRTGATCRGSRTGARRTARRARRRSRRCTRPAAASGGTRCRTPRRAARREAPARGARCRQVRRVVQRRELGELVDRRLDHVVMSVGSKKRSAAVHDAVADGDRGARRAAARARRTRRASREAGVVIGDRQLALVVASSASEPVAEASRTTCASHGRRLADPLDEPGRERALGGRCRSAGT